VQLDRYYSEIAAAGVELYAVSVDPPEASKRLRERLRSDFTFLSDPHGELLDQLGILHRGGHDGTDIAYPTAVLVDERGTIRWVFVSGAARVRASPEAIFAALSALE
jgi:peroxiredoxin